eukprot:1856-Rhodomonas_salina.1
MHPLPTVRYPSRVFCHGILLWYPPPTFLSRKLVRAPYPFFGIDMHCPSVAGILGIATILVSRKLLPLPPISKVKPMAYRLSQKSNPWSIALAMPFSSARAPRYDVCRLTPYALATASRAGVNPIPKLLTSDNPPWRVPRDARSPDLAPYAPLCHARPKQKTRKKTAASERFVLECGFAFYAVCGTDVAYGATRRVLGGTTAYLLLAYIASG